MAFTEFELKRYDKIVKGYIDKHRPPVHIRNQVDLAYRIKDYTIEIFEIRSKYDNSKEKFEQLNPYILLPEKKENNFQQEHFQNSFTPKNQIKIAGKFNPDNYSANDWQKMGFSERQAESIVKYKNYLGGSFISKEKFNQ